MLLPAWIWSSTIPDAAVLVDFDPQQGKDEGHADVDAVLDLTEIGSPGIIVDFDSDLIHAGKRMENKHVVLCPAHDFFGQNIEIFQADVVFFIEETLALYTCHIEDIETADDAVQTDAFLIGDALFVQYVDNVIGDPQLVGRDEYKANARIAGHGFNQGVDGAAEFEIAAEADGHVAEPLFQRADRHEVCQCLCGMLVAAVAAVDDGDAGGLFRDHGSALFGMTDGSDICKAGDGADGIRYALAFGDRGAVRVRKSHGGSAHIQHGCLGAQPCAGRGFVEECRQFLSAACICVFFRICFNICRSVEKMIEFAYRKIQRCQNMAHVHSFLYN